MSLIAFRVLDELPFLHSRYILALGTGEHYEGSPIWLIDVIFGVPSGLRAG